FQSLGGGEDAAVKGVPLVQIHLRSGFLDDVLKARVEIVRHLLEHDLRVIRQCIQDAAHVDVFPRLDGLIDDAKEIQGILQVVEVEDHADAAGDACRMRQDHIACGGEVIGAAATQVHDAGHHGKLGFGAKTSQLAPHDVGGGDAAAGAVDAHHHGTYPW